MTPDLEAKGYPKTTASQAWKARAEKVIPCLTQTLAKGPTQYVQGVSPVYLERGEGARVWDVDGNRFLDFNMAIGPVSLGYSYPKVNDAITTQLKKGITFSLMHPLEVEVAEMIQSLIPHAESVRFSKTGADVTSAAVRLSRAYTGRDKVLVCGYHGWHDWYISTTPKKKGIPEAIQTLTSTFKYNDLDSLSQKIGIDVACVILEPMLFEKPTPGFLEGVRALCDQSGSLLIFDEMWTGFRLSNGGAQDYFKVRADLATFSKAIANGMPLSVLCGRQDVMSLLENDVFHFTTFGGEALSLAAAKATIEEYRNKPVIEHFHKVGTLIQEGFNAEIKRIGMPFAKCVGFPGRTTLQFKEDLPEPLLVKSLIQQELIRKGILWSGFHVLSYSHTQEDAEFLLSCYWEILPLVAEAIETKTVASKLDGSPMLPSIRTTTGR